MIDKYEKIQRFFNACDELIGGTFMLAEQKVSEILKAISGSTELTNLFSAAAEGFDYPAAKKNYLRFPAEKDSTHGIAYLPEMKPQNNKEILAFVFCVLVEIDAGVIKLNDFLLRYFYEDGSYTASFAVFTGRMIRPFRDIVRSCFPDLGDKGQLESAERRQEALFAALSERVAAERARIAALTLLEDELTAFEKIFTGLAIAVSLKETEQVSAILACYKYFLHFINAGGGVDGELFEIADALS